MMMELLKIDVSVCIALYPPNRTDLNQVDYKICRQVEMLLWVDTLHVR